MPFTSAPTIDIGNVGSGEPGNITFKYDLSFRTFETGLQIGRFAKYDAGSLDNMDASATPVLAGVVLDSPANPIEDGQTYSTDNTEQVMVRRVGETTVEVVTGQTPVKFGAVFAHNLADADAGKAVTAITNAVATTAEFISEVTPTVWTIRLK